MQNISGVLVDSLKILGLSGYEARIYAALVLYDAAEAKDLVDFLAISKPSIYEGLDRLEEMGLAVKRNSKPAMFSPVPPEIAVKILLENHTKAAKIASRELAKLEQEKVHADMSDAVWTVYGDANIERKVRMMIRHATTRIECLMAGRYIPLFEGRNLENIWVKLLVISDEPDMLARLQKQFNGRNHEITVISLRRLMDHLSRHFPDVPNSTEFVKMENVLELIVDDAELLSIPPIPSNHLTGLNTSNKAMILHSQVMSEGFWKKLVNENSEEKIRGKKSSR